MGAKAKAALKRYDLTMIRDFLDHLLWEVRISHFETVMRKRGKADTTSSELVETLSKYNQKYGSVLQPILSVKRDGLSDEELNRAMANANAALAPIREDEIRALESLQSLFASALKAAECRTDLGFLPYSTVSAREFLDAEPVDAEPATV